MASIAGSFVAEVAVGAGVVSSARGSDPSSFVAKPVERRRNAKPRDCAVVDRRQRCRAALRERVRGDDRPTEVARDLFETRGEVHRGTDAGEVEPASAADVAVENLAEVEREPEAH